MTLPISDAILHETVMDVTEEQIAHVYGQAFLGVAEASGKTDALVDELRSLVAEVLDKVPAFLETLDSVFLSPEQKEQLLDKTLGGASTEVMNLIKVMLNHGRLGILRSVMREVLKLNNKRIGRTEVQLSVAHPVDDGLLGEISAALKQSLGTDPELSIQIDPDLIAGFVVRVGDTVYDGSVKTQFEKARKAMVNRAVERIEASPETFFNGETR